MPTYNSIVGEERMLQLPAELCRRLKIGNGTKVEFFVTLDGYVHFHAITGVAKAFARSRIENFAPPLSIREMDDAIAETLIEKHDRIVRQYRRRRKARPMRPAAE